MSVVTVVTEDPFNIEVKTDPPKTVEVVQKQLKAEISIPGIQGPPGASGDDLFTGPEFVYNLDGTLSTITYDDGSVKTFTWNTGKLEKIVFAKLGGDTIQKEFFYDIDGRLERIDQSVI